MYPEGPTSETEVAAAEEVCWLVCKLKWETWDRFRELPRRDRYLWHVRWFDVEVTNGGFAQYFYNSAGDHWMECLEALKAIGATRSAELLRQFCDLFPLKHPSKSQEIRRKELLQLNGGIDLEDLVQPTITLDADISQKLLQYYKNADPLAS